MTSQAKTFGFLGAGKMARAFAAGLAAAKPPFLGSLAASARKAETLRAFGEAAGSFGAFMDNAELVGVADVVVLGIKPGQAAEVLEPLKDLAAGKLVVSLLAGVTTARLEALLPGARVVRTMPNTPALIGKGITGYALGRSATEADAAFVAAVLEAVGEAVRVEEAQLDAVTAVSGSGPAYVYHFINALIEGGVAEGLSPEVARRLAVATVGGAAAMAAANPDATPLDLAAQVKSPNGTTVAGCNVLAGADWEGTVKKAVAAARKRAEELRA